MSGDKQPIRTKMPLKLFKLSFNDAKLASVFAGGNFLLIATLHKLRIANVDFNL